MSFAAVHIPEFPVAAWLYNSPELMARPLVLLSGTPPQETVASLNAIAAASGVSHGMSKVQAETACRAHFRSRDESEEKAAFQTVLEAAGRFSPRVQSIAAPTNQYGGKDRLEVSLLIDRSGTGTLFGTAQSYAQRFHDELAALGFPAGVATAPNADASLMLARSSNRILCAEQTTLRESLATLPTSLLSCDPKTHAVLRRWGIKTLGQLAELPTDGLISRLGQAGKRLQQLARGEAPHLLAPAEQAFSLSESLELESPLDDLERLVFALSRLLTDILRNALEHAYAIRSLTAIFALDHAETHSVHIAPANPTQNGDALLRLLSLELEAHPPQSEVLAVRLDADPAQPQRAQAGLFQSQFPDPDKTDLLLARLRSIAGEQNVGSPELANSHREDAFTIASFRPEPDDSDRQPTTNMRPALRILRPAQSVRVWLANERPELLFWRGSKLRITDLAGPWHSSGSWWDRKSFDCDFWDVLTIEPPLMLRLQQDHAAKIWNVVGLYD